MLRSERVRTKLLSILRIRPESGFFTLSPGGVGAIESALEEARSSGLAGDYYEFGVYRGYTLWHAQRVASRLGLESMRFFGFDSFDGLPDAEGPDREAGLFFAGDYRCTRENVERNLTEHGFDWNRGFLVEGYFDKVLTPQTREQFSMAPAALVMFDCDLYQSVKPAIDFMADLLQDGSILLFDDWNNFGESDRYGSRRALREFLSAHPEWTAEKGQPFMPYGQMFTLRRAAG